jgi:hypothetical protein
MPLAFFTTLRMLDQNGFSGRRPRSPACGEPGNIFHRMELTQQDGAHCVAMVRLSEGLRVEVKTRKRAPQKRPERDPESERRHMGFSRLIL